MKQQLYISLGFLEQTSFFDEIIHEIQYFGKEKKGDKMLVLSRKKDETIIMRVPGHEDIRLTVVRIDNMNKVRIGVEANKDVVILRSELETKKETAPVNLVKK